MGFRIEAPKQDGNARFNTLKVNLNENNSATRTVVADTDGNFYYGTGGGGGTGGTNGTSGTSGPSGASGTSGTSGTGFNTISNPLLNRVLLSDGSTNSAIAATNLNFSNNTLQVTGSLIADSLLINSDVFEFTGSLRVQGGITGSLFGTSSWAIDALTSSFVTASNVYGPYGSNSIISASHAATASSADTFVIRSDKFEFTGSLEVLGGITGSLFGTSSWAVSASWAPSAQSDTASYVSSSNVYGPFGFDSIKTASFAFTASSADSFFIRSDKFEFTGSLQVLGGITGSLLGSASYAVTAAYALNAEGLSGGTTNYIPIWTGTSTLSSSILYQTESRVGINTTAPSHSLHIVGSENTGSFIFYTEASGSFPLFRIYNSREGVSNPGLLTSSFNESFGIGSLMSSSISNNRLSRNVALGAAAMRSGDNIRGSIAIGVSAMLLATGSASSITGSIAIGDSALGRQLGGLFNIAIGTNAMLGVSSTQANTGDRNVAVGGSSLQSNTTGTGNIVFGDSAMNVNSVGSYNSATGFRSLRLNTSGSYNSAVGIDAFFNNTTASYGTAIGAQALYDNLTGDRNIALGFDAGRGITSGRANTIIGSVTGLSAGLSNNIILADGDGNIRASHNAVSWSFSGSVVAPQGFTGSLFGTASWATNALTASSADTFVIRSDKFEFTGSVQVLGGITGSLFGTSSFAVTASHAITASHALNVPSTASYALVASSSIVTDTTTGIGPFYLTFVDGTTGNRPLRVDSNTLTFNATTNILTATASNALTASSADTFYIRSDVFEFTGSVRVQGGITGSLFGTSSWAVSASWAPTGQSDTASFVTGSNVYGPFGSNSIRSASFAATASSADSFTIRSDVFEFTGSVRVQGSITGSLLGTSSFAITASHALNVPLTASYALVASSSAVTDTTSGTGPFYLTFVDGTTGNRPLRVDSNTLTFNATTNILTATASQALTASFINVTGSNAFVQGGNSFGTTAILGTNDAQSLQFEANGTVRMTITGSNGNIGIGTANPGATLSVVGSTDIVGATTISGSSFSNTGTFSIQRLTPIGTTGRQLVITSGNANAANISTANNIICIGPNSGASLTASGADSIIAIGNNAAGSITTGGSYSVIIGRNAGGGITTGFRNIIISSGDQTNIPSSTSYAIHIVAGGGYEGNNAQVVLGGETSQYAFIGGGSSHPEYTRRFYFGGGAFVTTPQNANIDFYAPSATGSSNQQGANFTINAGRGTGNGSPGDFIIATAAVGSSGNQNQSLVNRVWVKGGSGNVGINETSPTLANLQVQGNVWALSYTGSLFGTSSWAVSASRATTSSFALTASFINVTGSNAFVQGGNSFGTTAVLGTNDAQSLVLETNGTSRITLDPSGNTNIATGYQFSSAGTLNWGTSGYNIGQLSWDTGGGANNYAAVYSQGIYSLRLGTTTYPTSIFVTSSNGNVGISTTTPQKPLEAISNTNDFVSVGVNQISSGSWTGIHFGYREANNLYRKSAIVFERTNLTENNAQGKVHILNGPQAGSGNATLSDAKLTIGESGNVGINTSTPGATLDVNGRIRIITGSTEIYSLGNRIYFRGESIDNAAQVAGYGMFLPQPNQAYNLYQAGSTMLGYIDTNAKLDIAGGSSGASIFVRLNVNGDSFLNGGNVGIGTATPTAKLHVSGGAGIFSGTNDQMLTLDATDSSWSYIGYSWAGSRRFYTGLDNTGKYAFGSDTGAVFYFTGASLGVGNTSPSTLLTVGNTSGDNGGITVLADNTSNTYDVFSGQRKYPRISLIDSISGGSTFQIWNLGNQLRFGTNAGSGTTSAFNVNAGETGSVIFNGNVGIKTSGPSYTLDVLGTIRATGDVIAYSDARVKDNVLTIENALEKVISLRGVSYTRKDTDDKSRKLGVIAQELLPIIPEVVSKDQHGNYSVSYGNIVGLLIEAIKEQQQQIEELKYLLKKN